jgi:histone H3/H4
MTSPKLTKTVLRTYLADRGAKLVTPAALEEYRLEVESYAAALAEAVVMAAQHAKRKKVVQEDVTKVMELFRIMNQIQTQR